MAKFFDRMMRLIGFEEEEEEGVPLSVEEEGGIPEIKKKKGTVVSLHTQKQMRVVVIQPLVFEDAQEIAENLKNRRPVIINLESADIELARRILDFSTGVAYALEGSMQKVGNGIFLFTPNNVDISAEQKRELNERGVFPWIK